MKEVTLYIETPEEQQTVVLEDEISIGRTTLAQIVLKDTSLSRLHSTIWREGDDIWVADEKSTNGTFVNDERIDDERTLKDGDEIRLGNNTRIFVEIAESRESIVKSDEERGTEISSKPKVESSTSKIPQSAIRNPQSRNVPVVPLLAAGAAFFIILFAAIAIFVARSFESNSSKTVARATPPIRTSAVIPIRVRDPLGGEDPDDLDDLISSWEGVEEQELKAETLEDIRVATPDKAVSDLNVTAAFYSEQKQKAFAPRSSSVGNDPPGTQVPPQLFGDGVIKQKAKLTEMKGLGYKQPMDFADLAQKRLNKELIEMPLATKYYFLDVGGSASENSFTAFSFATGNTEITPSSPKYQILAQLAANFDGKKYDLNNSSDRRQMRIRMLRMFNQRAKPVLEELGKAYEQKFGRALRVTSLTRSMDYQIGLNANNPNSFKVRGEGSLPPHTSGCAFDLARKHMTAEEQNFVMAKLAEMEQRGILDALREGGANACFHVFIYPDGKPPRM